MAYYMRLFTKSAEWMSIHDLAAAVRDAGHEALYGIAAGSEAQWLQVHVRNNSGQDICVIERTERGDGLFDEELAEFYELLRGLEPRSGAVWVSKYLKDVAVTYAVRVFQAAFDPNATGPHPGDLLWSLKHQVGELIQADGEGFTNEDGYTVVWQFAGNVTGDWAVAVLDEAGNWHSARIDLGDKQHRLAFKAGRLPESIAEIGPSE